VAGIGYPYVPWWGNALLAIWVACVGATVGSFMNVVIFRVPEGLSVVHPGSRCPKCLNPICWYDNIPILSWILLRGKCRYCGLPISSRYLTLETAVAAIFLVVAFVGPVTSGHNLPQTQIAPPLRMNVLAAPLWGMYAFHMLLVTTLICAALIRYDGHRTPFHLYVPAGVVGFVAPLIWPALRPIPFFAPVSLAVLPAAALRPSAIAAIDGTLGIAVAALVALAVVPSPSRSGRRLQVAEVPAILLCGLYLGWQAVWFIVAVAALFDLVTTVISLPVPRLRRIPWTGQLVAVTVLFIIFWRFVVYPAQWWRYATAANGLDLWAPVVEICATVAPGFIAAAVMSFVAGWLARPVAWQTPATRQSPTTSGASPMPQPIEGNLHAILNSPSYRLAEEDSDFLKQDALRPVRLQLELLKPEMALENHNVSSTIVAFGGTQIVDRAAAEERLARARKALAATPDDPRAQRTVARTERVLAKSHYYDAAREFAQLVSSTCQVNHDCEFVIITGGGPGVMEAANRGAYDVGAKSIGLNITLPREQTPNSYITPDLCFQFHYFALRKMHFLFRAKALVVFPGGFGTLDELFDALTLRQTNRMQAIPIVLFGKEYWNRVIDFQFLADEGVIADEHLDLIDYAESPAEAWRIITQFHGIADPGESP